MSHHRHHHHAPSIPQDLPSLFASLLGPLQDSSSLVTASWAPRVDIRETPQSFLIHAELPGIEPKDIEVSMDKGILTLKGQRQQANLSEGETAFRVERQYGEFHRRFSLPDTADADGITATTRHGVLEIVIPKKAQVQPRRIEVNG